MKEKCSASRKTCAILEIAGKVLLPAFLLGGCIKRPEPAESRTEPPPILVAVAQVEERPAVVEQTFVGTVVPMRIAVVASAVEGQVVEYLARKGSFVQAQGRPGAIPLARLRTNEVVIEIAEAVAELAFRQHEFEELKLSAPREIEQTKARLAAAETVMKFAQWRTKRAQDLHHQSIASDEELEQLRSAAEETTRHYEERKAAWDLAESGLWTERLAQAQAKLEVQRRRIERLREDLAQREIYAPFDGYVTEEHVEAGEWVAPGGQVAELVEIDEVYVEVAVFESSISEVRVGTKARVDIDALLRNGPSGCSDDPGNGITGEVAAVVPKADLQSRSFPVRVRLKNPRSNREAGDGELLFKPGMFARVTLPVRSRRMVSIPKDSLVLSEAAPFVWMIEATTPEGLEGPGTSDARGAGETVVRAQRVTVEVTLQGPDDVRVEVVGPRDADGGLPLKPGQWIVVEGNERITAEQRVRIVKR